MTARWTRARWLVLALAGLGVLAICSAIVADGTVSPAEREAFRWVNGLPDWLESPLWIFQQAGNIAVATLVTATVGLAVRNRRLVVAAPVAAGSKLVLERMIKLVVERPRPGTSIGREAILRGHVPVDGLSFVSGHAAITTAMAVLLTATLPARWKPVPWLFVGLNGFGRVHAGAHNPLDIVGGGGLGLAIGATTVVLLLSRGDEGQDAPFGPGNAAHGSWYRQGPAVLRPLGNHGAALDPGRASAAFARPRENGMPPDEAPALCPECHGPLSGLGPIGARHRGRKPASPSNGYCMTCHIGLTRTDGHWARSAGRR